MQSPPEKDPRRFTKMRKRFEDEPAVSANPDAPADPAAEVPPDAPAHPDIPENTMSGGILPGASFGGADIPVCRAAISPDQTMSGGIVPGQNSMFGTPSLNPANTMTGGMLPNAASMQHLPDHTLTGGLGNAAQQSLRSMQTLTRGRKFEDFPGAPAAAKFATPAPPPRKVIRVETDRSVWKVGDTIEGKYDVTAIAGQGGMGVVYKVHHREWHIDMAVKTPLPALVRDTAAKARFLREAQIWVDLGLHPNLVQCWYVRELGGLPRVFVDYLAGGSLKDWLKSGRVGPGQWSVIIDLMVQACDGLGYAHERGVVHRDIKPGNMLLSADGRLCITDFGLVKIAGLEDIQSDENEAKTPSTSSSSGELTRTGLSLGTPQYGAPEQWGQARHVDARADIYALGITLYEIACGRRPFDESGKGEPAQIIIARHLSSKPPDPRSICKELPDSLAELALRCLAKDPNARPQSLADVRGALAGAHEKIFGTALDRAAPEIAESRASGLNNRAVSMWDLGQPAHAEAGWREALELDPRHPESIYNASLVEFRAGKITDYEAAQRLREAAKSQRKALLFLGHLQLETCDAESAEKSFLEALTDSTLAGDAIAWRALGHAQLALEKFKDAEASFAKAIALMPSDDAALLGAVQAHAASRSAHGKRLYPNIGCARTVEDRIGSVRTVAVAVNGLSIFSDGALNSVCQFETHTGRQIMNFSGHTKQVLCVAPTPDGRALVCGGEDSVLRMWALDTGFLNEDFYGKGHIASINALAISPDSTAAVTGGSDKSVRLWELGKGTLIRTLWAHEESVGAVAFAPDGGAIVSGGNDATLRVWEMPSGNLKGVLKDRLTAVKALAFSRNGRYLYSGGSDGRILKWHREQFAAEGTLAAPVEFRGHRGNVNSLAVLPNGRFLLSGGDDNTVRIWDTESGRCLRTLSGHQGAVNAVAVTPEGSLAFSGASENLGKPLRVWNLEMDRYTRSSGASDPFAGALYVSRVESQDKSQKANRQFKSNLAEAAAAFESAQYSVAHAALKRARKVEGYERDPRVLALNARLAQKLPLKGVAAAYLRHEIQGRHANGFRAIAFDARYARALSIGRGDKNIGSWALTEGVFLRELTSHKQSVEGLALTPDSAFLISAGADFNVGIWDLLTGGQKFSLQGHRGEVNAAAVDRDGRLAATASSDGTLKLWDIAKGRCVKTLETENSSEALCAVKFMPDGRAVIAGGRDGSISLWSIVTGKCARTFPGHSGAILDLAVFADKPHFLSAGEDKSLRLWNAENAQNVWIVKDGVSRFNSIAVSVDGRFIFSAGMEGPNSSVSVWEAAGGKQLQTLCPHSKGIACLALSPDGGQMLTGSEDKYLRVWDFEWELLSTDPLSALTVHLRKPPSPSGIHKRDSIRTPSGEVPRFRPDDPSKPKGTIFLDGRGKPKQ